ncbi:bifunctional metallophosphatase/5'-nucleotidase [Arcanobacterium phocisimile]|uniref:Bifunctional metallophosphatase/5'-nucleotidase n=1 Tax=Arcanobacterium phocisimile TaxID=1302235 RepID=A0ABX7IHB0_9ACTO|nr:bifunctional UDP-sugar hydrolase/5'-nucleotidase [Arcanobacterium phocisimile]QRV02202.1 bifunctional metallophosphatase/5'-nucleotidase [Arcanobacterium phocisimile]
MKKRVLLVSFLLSLSSGLSTTAMAEEVEQQDNLFPQASILFFQDGHDILPVKQGTKEQPTYHGGVARLATVLDQEKEKGIPVDVAFGGDLGGGTLFGAVFHGEAMVDAFNTIGVDVAGFGQHDFDYGLEQAMVNVKASHFPWVSSNLTANNSPIVAPTILRQVGDVKIGYIGLTVGMETTTAGNDVVQHDYVESAKSAISQLSEADVIVALAQFPNAEDAKNLLEEVPEISVVLREENEFKQEGNDVTRLDDGRFAVATEGNYGSIARIDFERNEQNKWVATHHEIQIDETVTDNSELGVIAQTYMKKLDARLSEEVTCSNKVLMRPQEIGKVAAHAFQKRVNADLGWVNAGGLRADLAAGNLTMKDILAVFPYDNKVMKIEVTGAQLRQAIDEGVDSSPNGTGGGYPIVSGMSYLYDSKGESNEKIQAMTLENGVIIDDEDTYTLAITNYVVNGGNNINAFKDAKVLVDAGFAGSDFDALVSYLTETSSCDQSTPELNESDTEKDQKQEHDIDKNTELGEKSKSVHPQAPALAKTGFEVSNTFILAGILITAGICITRINKRKL